MHRVPNGYCGMSDSVRVSRSRVGYFERPLAVVVQGEDDSRGAPTSGARSDAFQGQFLEFGF
jgi:hypothetical protein